MTTFPQVLVLAQRYGRFWVRTPAMLLLEVAAYACYGFFFGTAFYRCCAGLPYCTMLQHEAPYH